MPLSLTTRNICRVTEQLTSLEKRFHTQQNILRNVDLLLESHRQLTLISLSDNSPIENSGVVSTAKVEQEQLAIVQNRIAQISEFFKSLRFLQSCSIASVASSEQFASSLKMILLNNNSDHPDIKNVIVRSDILIQKCWDNSLVAVGRILEHDLDSIESYLDDRVYQEIEQKVLQPLIALSCLDKHIFAETREHFLQSYVSLRESFLRFSVDEKLNMQLIMEADKGADLKILDLIERTRLMMFVERREFHKLFNLYQTDLQILTNSHLYKVLEMVGNLLYNRIEQIQIQLKSEHEKTKISRFIKQLKTMMIEQKSSDPTTSSSPAEKDPFYLFLNLLAERFFPFKEAVAVEPSQTSSPLSNTFSV